MANRWPDGPCARRVASPRPRARQGIATGDLPEGIIARVPCYGLTRPCMGPGSLRTLRREACCPCCRSAGERSAQAPVSQPHCERLQATAQPREVRHRPVQARKLLQARHGEALLMVLCLRGSPNRTLIVRQACIAAAEAVCCRPLARRSRISRHAGVVPDCQRPVPTRAAALQTDQFGGR